MFTPHIVSLSSVSLSIVLAISFPDFEHYIVALQDALKVLAVVVDFVSDTCVWEGAVGPECLEGSRTDVQDLHYVLAVEEVADEVGGL